MKKHVVTKRGSVYYWMHKNPNDQAKCLVFTHGLCANHTMFEHQIEHFKNDYTIITWDIPLHGLSRPYKDFSYKNSSDDLNLILQKEGIDYVLLVGMSMGGYLCQEFCKKYSEKVLGFVALDTTPLSSVYYTKLDMWLLGKLLLSTKILNDVMIRDSIAHIISTTEHSYCFMKRMLEDLTKQEIKTLMNFAYTEFKNGSQYIEFNAPVLILIGENDKTKKVKKFCNLWAEYEGHELCYIKNASHFSHGDNEAQVNDEIDKFISYQIS